jgi:Transglutaminase-like superfamily
MKLTRKFKRFVQLRYKDRLLVVEAVIMLAIARFCILAVPFRILAKWLDRAPDAAAPDSLSPDARLPVRVGWAIAAAARNVPWNAVCLPQAIAAKAMLARRGQGSAFHLGAMVGKDGTLSAHAWLECGGRIVTGATGMRGMSPLARFG